MAGAPRGDSSSGGSCLFGCTFGDDAIEHYRARRHLHSFAARHLRLPMAAAPADRSADFLGPQAVYKMMSF
jgi:hypothetical protein